jgi:diketogulonate reductase-like aldo/keto reductase
MMLNDIRACTTLNNGVQMPWLGFGTFRIPEGDETYTSVRHALDAGYRSIDTAALYENEVSVGRAVRDSGIPREEIFITTKVWNDDQRRRRVLQAFEESLTRLEMDYVDLYLVHWPVPETFVETWGIMEEIYRSGKARAIGVSNHLVHHLEAILKPGAVVPAVNQVEFHPYLQSRELHAFCRQRGIQLEAWAPLMKGKGLSEPVLQEIAARHGKTPAQVVIRWELQKEVVAIPKSVHRERIYENRDVFDFSLDEEDMRRIDGLERDQRYGAHPDRIPF